MKLRVVEALTDPGARERANDDAHAEAPAGALVIDGATGLTDSPIFPPSDAAWLARFAARRLSEGLGAAPDLRALVREVNQAARDAYHAAGGDGAPAYAAPTASLQLLRVAPDGALETAGLGDCSLFLTAADGAFHRMSGHATDRGAEQDAARRAIEQTGGFSTQTPLSDPTVLAALRDSRARHNTPGGSVWTLGLAPEAADHLAIERLSVATPARALLMSDGFADLVDLFGAYDGPGLLHAAFAGGLAPLLTELRRFEREIDPDGARFPRFKQSDDATALAIEITEPA